MKAFLLLIVSLGLVITLAVVLLDRQPAPAGVDYREALESTSSSRMEWVVRGSPEEAAALARFQEYWRELREDRIRALLPAVYAEDVWFNDTVRTITNRGELLEYMMATAGHVASCRVEVQDIASTPEGYYLRWQMTVVPRHAGPGEQWPSIGISHIRFNAEGKVVLHQDYWDAAGGLYEHFPVVGWLIRNIKARL